MIIFANGVISSKHIDLPPAATIIAADGGVQNCLKMGIVPHVVIGDFDSLSDDALESFSNSDTQLIRYPVDKDETDLELALNYAVSKGATNVTLYGLLGGRWDMSFANILLLRSPRYTDIRFHIIDGNYEMFILRAGETLELPGTPGDLVSVIPLSDQTSGITYSGLAWHLEKAALEFGSPRGVSNQMVSAKAHIQLESGILFVILLHQDNQEGGPVK